MALNYGYMRVSSQEQNEDRQRLAPGKMEIAPERIFMDRQSGRDFARPGWQALLESLAAGDTLRVLSLNRPGCYYEEIQAQWGRLTREMGVDICVLDMPFLDTYGGGIAQFFM